MNPSPLLSIIIPVYNEAKTLEQLLTQVWEVKLPEGIRREVIIVDNNSSDGSDEIGRAFAESRGKKDGRSCRFLLCKKRGKGAAVQMGLKSATGDIVLIQDADLEYSVSDYPALLEPILTRHTNFVLGSRHLAVGNWKIRKFINNKWQARFLNLGALFIHGLFNTLYGVKLTDPSTMYKVFRRECIEGLHFKHSGFEFDFELAGKLIRTGNYPYEVGVAYQSRDVTEGKKIRLARDSVRFTWAILRTRFTKL